MSDLTVVRQDFKNAWIVRGESVEAIVFGSAKYGPNGAINGKGALKFRKEILAAVKEFMKI